ncbi:GNAT family acetyltransferase [Legionella sainthelensi]|uniref:GNAT family acetyltransferase n=1 Tax=Legionella sainthelensi TaxID=28087 RepID=A0A0W0YSX9_9GAMM|nr:GNAT family N-acetyltransferase [Legionella sainthelensi]KTD59742.1 GNAT family acetyltransferase [Legionella sainthelensi]VEH31703.1 GNAT family acetyltransferase [Legionella sainthelensi]
MTIFIKKVSSDEDIKKCLEIRFKVFVEGQHVPLQEEVDGKDTESEHYLLWYHEHPCGTVRVRYVENFAKIERVAILDEYQGKGLGFALMRFILSDLQERTLIKKIKLSSQTYAIPFYEKLGFLICSDEYMDAGIPHKDMQLFFE